MDALALAHLARAASKLLSGGWVQRIWQDERGRLTLRVRGASTHLLMISADKEAPGFGIIGARPPSPKNPRRLLAYLRAHLEGGRIEQVETVPFQRVVIFHFTSRSKKLSLVLEAVKHTPVILALDEEGVMRSADSWDPSDERRKLVPSERWIAPQIPSGSDTPATAVENTDRWIGRSGELSKRLLGLPPELRGWFAGLCDANSPGYALGELLKIYEGEGELSVKGDKLTVNSGAAQTPLEALESAGGWLLGGLADNAGREEPQEDNKRRKRWEKKLRRRIANIKADLEGFPEPERLKREADALYKVLHTLKRGAAEVLVPDPDDSGENLLLPLDKRLTPGENLSKLYERVKKNRRA
ncbi:MAG: hypothetical protein C0609_08945, partial [Deltaproteobacteria bacterium]